MKLNPKSKMKALLALHDVAMLPKKVHAVVFTLSLSLSTHVMAATGTFSGMFQGWEAVVRKAADLLVVAAVFVGIASVLYGVVQMIKKGMGRGDDVEWRQILWPMIGGSLAAMIMWVLGAVIGDSGGSESDIGRRATF